jgi:short-subunit dehydrogenase
MAATEAKVVVVTGASSGIGAAVAREAARRGHHLVLTARRADRLESLARELRAGGTNVLVIPTDLGDPDAPHRLVEGTLKDFGGIDVLINNAGIGLPKLFAEADADAMRYQILVNLAAPIVLTRLALPSLLERKGIVINVGSAITSVANAALGAYGATKAGLGYWNDALRRELMHRGLKVCLVEPGPVKTEFFGAMGIHGPQGTGIYNPLHDPPPDILSADVDDAARRIVRLIDHPRRRISVLRRVVWPHRLVGALFQFVPWLGDLGLNKMVIHHERTIRAAAPSTSPGSVDDARPHP